MPAFSPYMTHDIKEVLQRLWNKMYVVVGELHVEAWITPEPVGFSDRMSGDHVVLAIGDSWGRDVFDCAWFNFKGVIPGNCEGHSVVALIDINGELCVVDDAGSPVRGLTNFSSCFAPSLGRPLKRVFEITDHARGGDAVDIWADAGCNDLFGMRQNNCRVVTADIAVCHEQVRALYYDMEVLHDLMNHLPQDSARYHKLHRALRDVCVLLKTDSEDEISAARSMLRPLLGMKNGDASLSFSAIGHAHLDLGWLWPVRETIRKGGRTFATALDLINRYSDYIFGASQPQLFDWMKQYYPDLYSRIRAAVGDGRIEAQGAAWVECDTNMPSGESLIRQMLYGKRFFAEEFGVDIKNLWLPDVFGYTAALPRILKGCDIDTFMTQKLSWSKIDVYPHHSFVWQGIGGDEVLVHLLPEDNYNSTASPGAIAFAEKNYKDKDVSSHALILFGIGDGGGGPGMEHLERLERIKNLSGICPVVQESSVDFFSKWSEEADRFCKWVGELYVEMHQGTLTTHGNAKRFNRLSENALHDWEVSSVLAGGEYPQQRLEKIWKEVLLYQFHDILPGSSIKRVYDEAYVRYQEMLDEVNQGIDDNLKMISDGINVGGMEQPVLLFNSLSWDRNEWVKFKDCWKNVMVSSLGYAVVDFLTDDEWAPVSAEESRLENDVLVVCFSDDGSISSIYDKRLQREILACGETANRLEVYFDRGDAWDFHMDYAEQSPDSMKLVSSEVCIDGPVAIMRQTYEYKESRLNQDVILTAGSARIDFITKTIWATGDTMLRAVFPVDVQSDFATYDIQFGSLRRATHSNTSWDLAKHEVAALKYADLSQKDFGVALLNDCKYGHKIKGNIIELNLLRSVPYPKAFTDASCTSLRDVEMGYSDNCEHQFTYSLLPHFGDISDGRVAQCAYELNYPLRTAVPGGNGNAPGRKSFFSVDNPAVIIETVKKAEDGDGIVLRLYESEGGFVKAAVTAEGCFYSVDEVDLLEKSPVPLGVADQSVMLEFKPFEIKTLIFSE